MRKRMYKGLTGLALSAALAVTAAGCGTDSSKTPEVSNSPSTASTAPTSKNAPDPVTLKMMLFGDKPTGMDQVLEEFYKRTKDTLNVKLDIEWSPAADHKERLKLRMAAGEKYDLVFDAPWMNLNTLVPQGAYIELDKYFNNDQYPGLKKTYNQTVIDANKMNGHNYYFPISTFMGAGEGIYIRKDLREKYGLAPIKSVDDLEAFYKKVQENEKGMVPLAVGKRGFYHLFTPNFTKNDPTMKVGAGALFDVVLSPDRKKVLGAVTIGDDSDKYAGFPAPLDKVETFYGYLNKQREWNKYLEKDAASQKDALGLFASGKAASLEGDIWNYNKTLSKLQAGVPEAKLELFAYHPGYTDHRKEAFEMTYATGNMLVIPKTSSNPDRAAAFIDWVYQSQENHDLFQFGIEGVHWQKVGQNEWKALGTHSFPEYELTANPLYHRFDANLDEQSKEVFKYLSEPTTYYAKPLAGFKFDTSPVKSEIAKVQPKYDEFGLIIGLGLIDKPLDEAQKANKEWKTLGLEKIRAEVIKQLQAYIDAGGK